MQTGSLLFPSMRRWRDLWSVIHSSSIPVLLLLSSLFSLSFGLADLGMPGWSCTPDLMKKFVNLLFNPYREYWQNGSYFISLVVLNIVCNKLDSKNNGRWNKIPITHQIKDSSSLRSFSSSGWYRDHRSTWRLTYCVLIDRDEGGGSLSILIFPAKEWN